MKRLDSPLRSGLKRFFRNTKKQAVAFAALSLSLTFPVHASIQDSQQVTRIGINNIVPSLLTTDGHTLSGDGSVLTGAGAKLYQCVFDDLSMDYHLSMLPVGRLEILLERGEIDMGALVSQTENRDQYAFFSDSVFETDFVVATNRSSIPEDYRFKGWNLSTALNTVFHSIAKAKFQAQLHPTNNWNSAMTMLSKQRVDGVFLASHILELDVSPSLSKGVNVFSVEKKSVGLYVSKKAKHARKLLSSLNTAIQQCKPRFPLD